MDVCALRLHLSEYGHILKASDSFFFVDKGFIIHQKKINDFLKKTYAGFRCTN